MNIHLSMNKDIYHEKVVEVASDLLPKINNKVTRCFKEGINPSCVLRGNNNQFCNEVINILTELIHVIHPFWRLKFHFSKNGKIILKVNDDALVTQAPGGPIVGYNPLEDEEKNNSEIAEREVQLKFIKNQLNFSSGEGISNDIKEALEGFVREWLLNASKDDFEKFVIGITGRSISDEPKINVVINYNHQDGFKLKMNDCLMLIFLKYEDNKVSKLNQKKFNKDLKSAIEAISL